MTFEVFDRDGDSYGLQTVHVDYDEFANGETRRLSVSTATSRRGLFVGVVGSILVMSPLY